MRILVLHSGRFEHFLAATRAVAVRHRGARFVGLVRDPDLEAAAATGLFESIHPLPPDLRKTASLPIWPQPFDACVVPFEDRLGVQYWTYRWVPIRHGTPLIYAYDRKGDLTGRTRARWVANTLLVCLGIRPVHEPVLRLWLWLRPHVDVAGLFLLAGLGLACAGLRTVGLLSWVSRTGRDSPETVRRLLLFIPSLGVGGAQRQIVSFLQHVDRRRWDVELATLNMPDKFFEPMIRQLGVPIVYLNPKGDFLMSGLVWRLAEHLRRRRCDVVHSWLHYAVAIGGIAGNLAGVRTIVGSLRSERPSRFPWFYPRWQRAIDILTAPLQSYVIANSNAVKEENRRWAFIPRRKLLTIHNGIDLDHKDLPDRERLRELRRQLGLPEQAGVVGIVGRLYPEKDHATFLRAARLIADAEPDTQFLVIGDGVLRPAIQAETQRLGLEGQVHLLGSRKDVLALIGLMDVSVLTSVSEGFPNVLLEAAVAGTPIVTTAAGGAAEVIEDGVSGYVVPCGDAEAVACRTIALLQDAALRRRVVQAASDRVRRMFSAPRIASAIQDSYGGTDEVKSAEMTSPRPLRICLISPYAYGLLAPASGLPVGGAEVQSWRLARELAQNERFAVTLVTGDGERDARERHEACDVVLTSWLGRGQCRGAGGSTSTSVPAPATWARLRRMLKGTSLGWLRDRWSELAAVVHWIRLLRDIAPDVVVMRCATPQIGYVQRACAFRGIRFVYQVAHEQDVNGQYAREHGVWGARFEGGLRRADEIVCQHGGQQGLLRSRCGRQGRVIRSLCPTTDGAWAGRIPRRFVLWVARLDDWKQPELLLDLAARIPDQHFMMVGPESETAPADMRRLRERMADLPNLTWRSGLPFAETASLYEEALVFVNTSRAEGFPNTFLHAAASGTPIVSWTVDPDGVVETYGLGFCAGRDWARFEQSVRLLCADEGVRERLGENGRRYVRAHHDPARIAGEYAELFLSLARPHGAVRSATSTTVNVGSR